MFSRTVSERNAWLCWNVRARPLRPRRCALHDVITRSLSTIVPAEGKSKPLSRLTRVDLPAPFGPIRPITSCAVQLERDTAEGVDPLERAGYVGGPEGSSGPPTVLRVLLELGQSD